MESIVLSSNARDYGNAISLYASETGKSFAEALAREAPDFRTELYKQFRGLRHKSGSIMGAAKARGYRVARTHNTFLVPTASGLSQRAINRAKEILCGEKSDLFRWAGGRLVPVRFSGRARNSVLQGGRSGLRFAGSALRAYQLSPETLDRVSQTARYKSYGVRRLNLRALATYFELAYRQRGAQGGTMGVQWLFSSWKKGNAKQRAQLVQRSASGLPIGTVDFEFDLKGNLATVVFTGFVPGSGEQARGHDVLGKVFAVRIPALMRAIEMSHQKSLQRSRLV